MIPENQPGARRVNPKKRPAGFPKALKAESRPEEKENWMER
jgi:hypothetical protein